MSTGESAQRTILCTISQFYALRPAALLPSKSSLFCYGKGLDSKKSTALSGTVRSSNSRNEKIKFLLEQGADPNTDVDASTPPPPPLHTAVAGGDLELVNLLLEHGAVSNLKAWDDRAAFNFNGKSPQDIEDAFKAAAERYDTQFTQTTFN